MGLTAALAFSQARRAGKAETLARARLLNYQGQAASEDQPLLGLRLALEGLTLFTPEDSYLPGLRSPGLSQRSNRRAGS